MISFLHFIPTQDLDKISEANELFDAVLTGTVDKDKKGSSKAASANKASGEEENTDEKTHKKERPVRRMSIYVGNFPWVRTILPL